MKIVKELYLNLQLYYCMLVKTLFIYPRARTSNTSLHISLVPTTIFNVRVNFLIQIESRRTEGKCHKIIIKCLATKKKSNKIDVRH